MEPSFQVLHAVIAIEALFRSLASITITRGIVLERRTFTRQTFTVATTVDGVLAIGARGLPVNILMAEQLQPNGLPALPKVHLQ